MDNHEDPENEVVDEIVLGPPLECNLREVDLEAAMRQIEKEAGRAGLSVRDYCLRRLGAILGVDEEDRQAARQVDDQAVSDQ